jgi:GMP synthase-like glutamine amidotransferase
MRAHYLQHVPFEGPGSISTWLESAGHTLTSTHVYAGEAFPPPGEVELLIVMGGPMSANDEDRLPWVRAEKDFIRETIASGAAVLGVCLGAQLIASALGATVVRNRVKEIGWFEVEGLAPLAAGALGLPKSFMAFHWHGETFDLPPGAVRLARSAACENQAFQIGDRIVGLQFHLETTPESAQELVLNCGSELVPAEFVQPAGALTSPPEGAYTEIAATMSSVLTYLTDAARIVTRARTV